MAKRFRTRPCLIYICLVDSHLQPAWISNKSPAIFLQARLEAAPDFILCAPYLEISLTNGSICFLNSSLKVETETPELEWKYFLDLALTILQTNGNAEEDCGKSLINRLVTATEQIALPVLARKVVEPSRY